MVTEDLQYKFLLNLKGCPTLYYKANDSIHAAFIAQASSPYFSYGCDLQTNCAIANLLDANLIEEVPFGNGAIHYAGRDIGTIHANYPAFEDRLVAIVTPAQAETIDAYLAAAVK